MDAENFEITAWVKLQGNTAVVNDSVFYRGGDDDEAAFVKNLYRALRCDYPKFFKMDALSKLAFAGTELLLQQRVLSCRPDEVALVFSNASSSLDTDKSYYNSVEDKSNYFPSPAVFVYTLPNIMMGEVCIRHGFLGENFFFISEKFDAGLLATHSRDLLESGKAKCVIAGWVEVGDSGREAALFLIEPSKEKESASKRLSQESLSEIYAQQRV
jgi:hypothetical protein